MQAIIGIRRIGLQGGIGAIGFNGCGQHHGAGGEGIGIAFAHGGQEDGILCSRGRRSVVVIALALAQQGGAVTGHGADHAGDHRGQEELGDGRAEDGLARRYLIRQDHFIGGHHHVFEDGRTTAGEALAHAEPVVESLHAFTLARQQYDGAAAILDRHGHVQPVGEERTGGVELLAVEYVVIALAHQARGQRCIATDLGLAQFGVGSADQISGPHALAQALHARMLQRCIEQAFEGDVVIAPDVGDVGIGGTQLDGRIEGLDERRAATAVVGVEAAGAETGGLDLGDDVKGLFALGVALGSPIGDALQEVGRDCAHEVVSEEVRESALQRMARMRTS